jgi:alpha-L-fucosidase
MKIQTILLALLAASVGSAVSVHAQIPIPEDRTPTVIVDTKQEPITAGKFQPSWDSLAQYQVPDWYRKAKFGIWAHWGPQCEPEQGDWYARGMYLQGRPQNVFHVAHYGPPSQFGFKDVINTWQAKNWDPEKLVALYKRVGAQYFFAMGNHHDNFDMWDSKYQPWNAVNIGPKKDIIAGWAKAAHDQGLPFGVSLHAAHAWLFYEAAQGADRTGPYAGVPYDGKLTKADGKGKWWNGLDPQDLYAQNHPLSKGSPGSLSKEWNWADGAVIPDQAYCEKFYNRTADLIKKYQPDLLYFDDNALPLWPISDAGLKIAADFYNSNDAKTGGKSDGVLLGKLLTEKERHCMVWDIERGAANEIEPLTYQTDTCIGNWHYQRSLYTHNRYKTAKTVIQMLCDIVSKNGNLLLNIPVRGDGTIDDKEVGVLQGIAAWMDVNKECIFDTVPWKVYGEGPSTNGPKGEATGMNENKRKPFTAADIRYTLKNGTLYAIVLGAPKNDVQLTSLGTASKLADKPVKNVSLLGSTDPVNWTQTAEGLSIKAPSKGLSDIAMVYKITM